MNRTWAKSPNQRHQIMLFSPSLEDSIPANHPIRVLDAILRGLDWSDWEKRYTASAGRPPVHPRLMAGTILYGMMVCGLRSSRKLEDATRMRLDFLWFLEGLSVDHSTFAKFRIMFDSELRGLFRQINAKVLDSEGAEFIELVIDGSRVRANSDRHGCLTASALEKRLEQAQKALNRALAEAAAEDDASIDPETVGPEKVQREIDELKHRTEVYSKALETAKKRDEVKRAKEGGKATAVRVPLTDPDAYLQQNKEGGYAPNYTPVVGVDSATGIVLSADVLPDNAEASSVSGLVEDVEDNHEKPVERVVADSGFASGANQDALEKKNIGFYCPVSTPVPEAHPALREDPSRALSEEKISELPRVKKTGKLHKNAFLYVREQDAYYCPMGRILTRKKEKKSRTKDGDVTCVEYQCKDCTQCPISDQCLSRKARRRMITRDEFEDNRERTARRMASEAGREIYKRRAPVVEGTFANIKTTVGMRYFLLRGIDKVRTEWLWACAAFNLKKLLKIMAEAPLSTPENQKKSQIFGVLRAFCYFVRQIEKLLTPVFRKRENMLAAA